MDSEKPKGYSGLVRRNVTEVRRQFDEDPSKVLVSVQLETEQIDHLGSGLNKRHRRLIPLTLLAEMVLDLATRKD